MPTTNPPFALVDFNKLVMEEETNRRRRRHHHHHHSLPTLKFRKNSADSVPDPDIEDPGYTSLRDIIVKSPTGMASRSTSMAFDGGREADLYSSGDVIPIRNQLVRRVASMYLQSAFVLSNDQDPSFPIRLWRRLRMRASSCPCWRLIVQNPVQTFLWRMYRLFACMLRP